MTDFAAARYFMVEGQIRPNKVTDHRLVDVLSELPREAFVPESARGVAYVDDDLPIGKGRFLLEPMVFARMLQAVAVQETDRVLDVGAAGGYSTAVLARLAGSVVGLDCDEDLTAAAAAALAGQGITNAKLVTGPLAEGYAQGAPYDVIVIEGTVPEVPAAIAEQLAEEGRLVAVVQGGRGVGEVRLFQRTGGVVSSRILFEAQPHGLPGFEKKASFVF
ncbi:protein-L-isoaspartate O-methyltransferase family protein [Azospirillum picis]|uniref:Protein-L-isoaspartate O-methyltransferase n=1 Tax=Azospirillum picis TaxID=488438 RepID=A0ABU0MGR3_9PROT|nr:protein-L-isoaspartate O-methyltransferase [Azospirillum picis]MBP2298333.1 protein-L-isoaspartate(D-aspartate) O-methyltransferase [Azospirillum picis]MDQ0532618.1 protein-L-isoaspartate(D-aspartate) O-methyltransferase [Azospirillum picis]